MALVILFSIFKRLQIPECKLQLSEVVFLFTWWWILIHAVVWQLLHIHRTTQKSRIHTVAKGKWDKASCSSEVMLWRKKEPWVRNVPTFLCYGRWRLECLLFWAEREWQGKTGMVGEETCQNPGGTRLLHRTQGPENTRKNTSENKQTILKHTTMPNSEYVWSKKGAWF